jgi:hypothetical protein
MYNATKTNDPLRLVLELPNTMSHTVSYRKILDNEIIDSIDTLVLVDHPLPLTRVVIGLCKNIPYKIGRNQDGIRVSFGDPVLLSQTDSALGEETADSLPDVSPIETTRARTVAIARLLEKKPADSAISEDATGSLTEVSPTEIRKTRSDATPGLSEEETGRSARTRVKNNLVPASKLLAIRAVEVDQKLIFSILANGSLDNHRAFHLINPPRLVVDIMGIRSYEVKSVLDFGGPLVDTVRVSLLRGKVRLVFDLIPQTGLPYQVVPGNDRLQVSFMPGSRFAALQPAAKTQTASRATVDSVQRFVERWRLAWEKGDLPSYIACYHPQFRNRGMGLTTWGRYKEQLFQSFPGRVIRLSDMSAELKGSTALVVVKQEYQSGIQLDSGLKTLQLRWHRGHWTIYRETWQPLPDQG